jgi:hypothetical protein
MNRFQKIMVTVFAVGSICSVNFMVAMDLVKSPLKRPTEDAKQAAEMRTRAARAAESDRLALIMAHSDKGGKPMTAEQVARFLKNETTVKIVDARRQAVIAQLFLEKEEKLALVADDLGSLVAPCVVPDAEQVVVDGFIAQVESLIKDLREVPGTLSVPSRELYLTEAKPFLLYAAELEAFIAKIKENRIRVAGAMRLPAQGIIAADIVSLDRPMGDRAMEIGVQLVSNKPLMLALCLVGAGAGFGLGILGLEVTLALGHMLPASQAAVTGLLTVPSVLGGVAGALVSPLTKKGATKRGSAAVVESVESVESDDSDDDDSSEEDDSDEEDAPRSAKARRTGKASDDKD